MARRNTKAALTAALQSDEFAAAIEAQAEPVTTEADEETAHRLAELETFTPDEIDTVFGPGPFPAPKEVQPVEVVEQVADEAPAPQPEPTAAEGDIKPKRLNPAREELLILMAEATDGGAKVWDQQPKTRDSTKTALLDGAFVTHDGKAASITAKGRAFATFAALHREAVNPAPKAPKAPKAVKPAEAPKVKQERPAKALKVAAPAPVAQVKPSLGLGYKLAAILRDIYGVSLSEAPALAVIWAASQLVDIDGVEVAKAELAEVNKFREQAGKIPAYAPYGSKLF